MPSQKDDFCLFSAINPFIRKDYSCLPRLYQVYLFIVYYKSWFVKSFHEKAVSICKIFPWNTLINSSDLIKRNRLEVWAEFQCFCIFYKAVITVMEARNIWMVVWYYSKMRQLWERRLCVNLCHTGKSVSIPYQSYSQNPKIPILKKESSGNFSASKDFPRG